MRLQTAKIIYFLMRGLILPILLSCVIQAQNKGGSDQGTGEKPAPPETYEKTWFGDDSQLLCPSCTQNGRSLVIDAESEGGFKPYGPYEVLPKGVYTVEFHFDYIRPKDLADNDLLLELDVGTWDESVSKYRAQMFFYGRDGGQKYGNTKSEKRRYALNFEVTDETMAMKWEFRVYSYRNADYSLEKIVLRGL